MRNAEAYSARNWVLLRASCRQISWSQEKKKASDCFRLARCLSFLSFKRFKCSRKKSLRRCEEAGTNCTALKLVQRLDVQFQGQMQLSFGVASRGNILFSGILLVSFFKCCLFVPTCRNQTFILLNTRIEIAGIICPGKGSEKSKHLKSEKIKSLTKINFKQVFEIPTLLLQIWIDMYIS